MTEYILKKDFFFAKAGKKVRIFYGSSQPSILFNTETQTIDLHLSSAQITILLVEEGWIEKIKPKEWYELRNSNLDALHSEKQFPTSKEAHTYAGLRFTNYTVVKVSKVIE